MRLLLQLRNCLLSQALGKPANTLIIQVNTRDDVRAQVSKEVTGSGGVIVGMSQKSSNLEDVFIQLVTKDQGGKT